MVTMIRTAKKLLARTAAAVGIVAAAGTVAAIVAPTPSADAAACYAILYRDYARSPASYTVFTRKQWANLHSFNDQASAVFVSASCPGTVRFARDFNGGGGTLSVAPGGRIDVMGPTWNDKISSVWVP